MWYLPEPRCHLHSEYRSATAWASKRPSEAALERHLGGQIKVATESPSPSRHSVRSEQSPRQQSEAASDASHEQAGAEEESSSPQPQASHEQSTMQPTALLEAMSTFQGLQPINCNYPFVPASASTADILEQPSTAHLLPDMLSFTSLPTSFDTGTFVPAEPRINGSLSSNTQPELPSRLGAGTAFEITELMKADLNHLYFDRVHLFAPILNSRRYFSRAARPMSATAPFVGLQHAMWTLAAWLGSQFREIQKGLYTHTRAMLEHLDTITESPPIELAQAWIFLAIYEIMQVNYDRGWLSAGRCFRLVQLMKLYEVDVPNGVAESSLSYVEIEERRRTFWMAYLLDRFINLVNHTPLTLNEQVILTRLPAPESAFQRDRPTKTQYLSKVITGGDDVQHVSPFNACIVLMTISGRCLSHHQQCIVERAYGNTPQDFLTRHQWLESILADKIKMMLDGSSGDPDDERADPMLLFTNMAAQATTLLLGKAMQSVPWNCEEVISGFEQRALEAAQKVCHLSQSLTEFGTFKIHPFTPIPLLFCAEFAQKYKQRDPAFEALYDSMIACLRDLSTVNVLAETSLARLHSSGIETDAAQHS